LNWLATAGLPSTNAIHVERSGKLPLLKQCRIGEANQPPQSQ